ncbi:integral membrane protein [Oceanicola granulosus HTCC2516]|uniref:Integral membrane protein n=1 Tax=Oceanicola granulosus (strain ATCC BAA-861 / DSM 15982 / KCTC 12143 / HTCC2516) TaxID=314256 RepID=Q2CDP8_OCEGH|nr:DMT family transporter [Oceanicola granulosus]EAR50802.1 integral membrane protein [Oceanicola granulosus HTCC2516]
MSPGAVGHLAMLTFALLVGGSFALGTRIANEIDPAALNAVRFLIATAIIGALAFATTGIRRSALAAPWRYLVLGGLLAIYFVLMFEGLKTASAVSAAAVFTLTPLLAAGFGWLLLRQRLTPRMAVALGLGALGALWVIFRGELSALLALDVGRGEAIYFVGVAAHAAYTPMVRKLNRGEPAIVFTFGMMLAGCGVLTVWGWSELVLIDWAALSPLVWITLVYLAVFASATTFVLLQVATLRLPSAKVMAYTYLTPSSVIAWEVALGGAVPRPVVALGVVLSAVALLLLLRDEERAEPVRV